MEDSTDCRHTQGIIIIFWDREFACGLHPEQHTALVGEGLQGATDDPEHSEEPKIHAEENTFDEGEPDIMAFGILFRQATNGECLFFGRKVEDLCGLREVREERESEDCDGEGDDAVENKNLAIGV